MSLSHAINALRQSLIQEQDLLLKISDSDYAEITHTAYTSSLGKHIRHNLDHLSSFLFGLNEGRIDYEKRQRDERIEQSRTFALAVIKKLLSRLDQLPSKNDKPLFVRAENHASSEEAQWLPSSYSRELQFLQSHAVHHHAIIATLPGIRTHALPAGFGIAPSTQRYQQPLHH